MPKILGFSYDEKLAEIKMEECGDSIYRFTKCAEYWSLTHYHRSCIIFDMIRQLIGPLRLLHEANMVHGDIKPDNICIRRRSDSLIPSVPVPGQEYISEFEFTLIDFGIVSKFKIKKGLKVNSSHIGNLMFSTLRGLKQQ